LVSERKYGDFVLSEDHNSVISALELAQSQAEQVHIPLVFWWQKLMFDLANTGSVPGKSEMTVVPALKWTFASPVGLSSFGIPVVADVDKDGEIEIIVPTYCDPGEVCLHYLRSDGTIKYEAIAPDWAWNEMAILAYDLNGDGKLEVLTTDRDLVVVFCFDCYGNLLWTFDGGALGDPGDLHVGGFTACDVDGDGEIELLFGSEYAIYCLRGADGSLKWMFTANFIEHGVVAIADIDEDGEYEIIFRATATEPLGVYCLRPDGTEKWFLELGTLDVNGTCGIADLDADGLVEILEVVEKCYVNWDGTIKYRPSLGGWGACGLVDINKDGLKEVLFCWNEELYCYSHDATLIWSYIATDWFEDHAWYLALADINNDGYPELLITNSFEGRLYCMKRDGTPLWILDGFGYRTICNSPVIADVDGDGNLELILLDESTHEVYCYGSGV